MDKNERPDRPTAGRRAPLIGSLSDCSAWLASQGIEYTPREILEDAAEGLLLLHVPVHEDRIIPVCVEKPTPDDIRAQFEAAGKDPDKSRTYTVVERPAIKGELIPVRPEECFQFLAAGETSVYGPGFTSGNVTMMGDAFSKPAKAILVPGIDGFKVKRKDMEDYRSRRFNAVKRVGWLEASLMDVEAQNSSSPEAVYSAEQAEAAATALQGYWFKFDTWKLAEGLKLLVGIDPRYSDSIEITDDGKVHLRAAPQCFRLGFPPKREFQEGKPFVVTTGQTNCRPEVDRLLLLRDIWRANQELASLPAAPPQKFIAFAESKGLAPYWLEAARAKGIVPADPERTPEKPAMPPASAQEAEEVENPQQRQREEPEERQKRRLDWVRARGADHNGEKMIGKRGVLAALARAEKKAGHPMSDEKDIRVDLKAAVERERNAPKPMEKGSSVFNQ